MFIDTQSDISTAYQIDKIPYLKDRFNYEYLILRFGYPTHFAGTNNCGIANYNNWGEPERAPY